MKRATPLNRSYFPLLRELPTRWSDNDLYGHLNNTIHYHLFDTVINNWLIENDLLDPGRSEVIGMVVDTGCSYFAELAYPQLITAGFGVERIGRTSVTYRIALFGDSDMAAAQGRFTHVLVNRQTRVPQSIPPVWNQALTSILCPEKESAKSTPSSSEQET